MNILLTILRSIVALANSIPKRLDSIESKLDQILEILTPEPPVSFSFTVLLDGKTTEGALNVTLSDSQRAQLTVTPLDKRGKPASLDGPIVWATSDATVCTVTPGTLDAQGNIVPAPDGDPGLSAVLEGVSAGNGARVTATGDADLGSGVSPIVGVLSVDVTAGEAVTLTINAGAPVDLP